MTTVSFRVDASAAIGSGHLMRCLALANALANERVDCSFHCRDGLGSLADEIVSSGHALHRLTTPAGEKGGEFDFARSQWLRLPMSADAKELASQLTKLKRPEWLVVDHYALDIHWERVLRPLVGNILVIDDLADRDHDCDLLLDQNLVACQDSRYLSRISAGCETLLGPRYALLRAEFALARANHSFLKHSAELPRVVVMFGGADPQELTLFTVKLLADIGMAGRVDVIAGPLYAGIRKLRAAVEGLPHAVLHAPAEDIAKLMAQADLAIGSPGTSTWERCVLGIPAVTVAFAENQVPIGEEVARVGAHWYAGRADHLDREKFRAILIHALSDEFARGAMRDAAFNITDGFGARRVASKLLGRSIMLRSATLDDAHRLGEWRNDLRNRRYFFDAASVPADAHLEWFSKALVDPSRNVLVVEKAGEPFGCLRFDRSDEVARVSIYLAPEWHGRGLGAEVLRAGEDWLRRNYPKMRKIEAEVFDANIVSRRAFERAGYNSQWTLYSRVLEQV